MSLVSTDQPPMNQHINQAYEEALKNLVDSILQIGAESFRHLDISIQGLLTANVELCNQAINDDEHINHMDKLITQKGLDILTRFNPLAGDLHQTVQAILISTHFERIGDHAANIAKHAKFIISEREVAETKSIEPLYSLTSEAIQTALLSYRNQDAKLAQSIIDQDSILDIKCSEFIKNLTKEMKHTDSSFNQSFINLIFIARCLERIGDLATLIVKDGVLR